MWEEYRDAAFHSREKICAAKAHLKLKLDRTVGNNKKRFFFNLLMAKASIKITSAVYKMGMTISQTVT